MLPRGCIKIEKRYAYLPVFIDGKFRWLASYYAVLYYAGEWVLSHNLLNRGQVYKCLKFYYEEARHNYLYSLPRDEEADRRAFDKVDFQVKQLYKFGFNT